MVVTGSNTLPEIPDASSVALAPSPETDSPPPAILPLAELEKNAILAALRQCSANRTKTAELLGISIRTLRNKLNEYRSQGETIEGDDN